MTQVEADARYHCYQRGWLAGSRNASPLDELGTSRPEFLDEYARGAEDGRTAFHEAMKRTFNRLRFFSGTDS